ncbi:MAG: HRDC domain-containing protein [Chloroflexota bacterium]|nr:HRDC domain-containing protein [Chloroflexota bacterium]
MTPSALAEATYIDSERELNQLVDSLRRERRIACDTESNSLHAYRGKICLIQLSTPDRDVLIDPLRIADISALGGIFADPQIEKVFHASEYDLICLQRDYNFDVRPVFDTMAAARVCGYKRIGLGNMLEDLLGLRHSKKHQTADWARRPLPASHRRYAQMDTRYLLPLRDILYGELQRAGRLEEAFEYFADVTAFEVKSHEFDPEGFWDLCRPKDLSPRQAAVLRELYILRDELAQNYDQPSHKLIANKALLQLATASPRGRKGLFGVSGLPAWLARQNGDEILQAISHGNISLAPPRPPQRLAIPQIIVDRYNLLHTWRKELAQARGLESDVILSKRSMWAIARRKPASVDDLEGIPGLGPWRRAAYGEDLLSVVNRPGG